MGGLDIILLPYCFLSEEFIEFTSRLLGLLVVTLDLAFLSIFLKEAEEVEDLIISRYINNTILTRVSHIILSVHIVGIVLGESIFNLLHHFYEVIEIDEFETSRLRLSVIILVLIINLILLLSDLPKEVLGLLLVSLKTLHDSLKVFHSDLTLVFLIKEVEDLTEVLNFFWCELLILLLILIWIALHHILLSPILNAFHVHDLATNHLPILHLVHLHLI